MNYRFIIISIFIVFIASCRNYLDPKLNLAGAFKGQNIDTTWNFETVENDSMKISAFKNKTIGDQIMLNPSDTTVVMGYFSAENKRTRESSLYKALLIRKDTVVSIEITDAESKLVKSYPFTVKKNIRDTIAPPSLPPGGYTSLTACINDFNCKHRGELQCLANQTCEPQYAALTCCLTNGQCYSVHIIITPTNFRCSIVLPNLPQVFALE